MIKWLKDKLKKEVKVEEETFTPIIRKTAKKAMKKKAAKAKLPVKKRKKSEKQRMKETLQKRLKNTDQLLAGYRRDETGELIAVLNKPFNEMSDKEKSIVGQQAVLALLDGSIKKAKL